MVRHRLRVECRPSRAKQNWADEIRKWLGHERLRCLALSPGADGKQQVGWQRRQA